MLCLLLYEFTAKNIENGDPSPQREKERERENEKERKRDREDRR